MNIIVTLKSELEIIQGQLVPFESFGTVSYSQFIVTMAESLAVCEIYSVKEWRDLENCVRGVVQGH